MSNISPNSQNPFTQFTYLICDLQRIINKRWWRWFVIWFNPTTYIPISYRIDRMGYLVFRKAWKVMRILFIPLFLLFNIIGDRHNIHYKADIGKGLKILHGACGVVVSGKTIAGEGLTLTGGNFIGGRKGTQEGDIFIGNNVNLGANAVILGPITLGNHIEIGAGAVVVKDFPSHSILAGVPAKLLNEGSLS